MPNTYNIDGEILFNESVSLKGWKYGEDYVYKGSKKVVSMICPKNHHVNINPYTFRNNKSDCIFCYRDKVKNKT